jgi:hypothetical protein
MLATSTEYTALRLPERSPAVITTRRMPRGPALKIKHLTDVSDCHAVAWHLVPPTRAIPVKSTWPRLDPWIVTDPEPVPGPLLRRITLNIARSIVYAFEMLPPRSATVSTTRRVPLAPWPTKHHNEVSECHFVFSHPVLSNRALLEKRVYPMLAPCTVTEDVPVLARFVLCIVLILVKSTEYAFDMLPLFCTEVTTVRRVP